MAAVSEQKASLSETYKCELCQDTGFILEEVIDEEYDQNTTVSVAKPCPKCSNRKYQGEETGIPEQYFGKGLSNFDFKRYTQDVANIKAVGKDFIEQYDKRWAAMSKGLYIWSNTAGSGKTLFACCLGKAVAERNGIRLRFVTHADYISKLMQDIDLSRQGYALKCPVYKTCDLLILDDLGTAKRGEYQTQCLFELINERMSNGLITIFTSNENLLDLSLDGRDRITTRIEEMSFPIHFPEESVRHANATAKNQEFLKSILDNKKVSSTLQLPCPSLMRG